MTAEIAVLNRTAVALAADSAATLVTRFGAKVNNHADKLFHLCSRDPVGIMLFGNAEFMDMPFEPIIKGFRSSDLSKTREHLSEYGDAFFEYLETRVRVEDATANSHVRFTFVSAMQPLLRRALDRLFEGKIKKTESVADKMGELFIEEVLARIQDLETKADCRIYDHLSSDELSTKYANEIVSVLDELTHQNAPSDLIRQKMNQVAVRFIGLQLKKNVFTGQSTGIAFAGFGASEQFPILQVYDTEGIIAGRVKRVQTDKVEISPSGQRGHIAPLAQDDVVKRYVDGIDPKLSKDLGAELRKLLVGYGDALAEDWFRGAKRKSAKGHAQAAANKLVDDFLKEVVSKATEKERQEIVDVVHYMSKAELAQLAEALVEMTALRRRVSMEAETVGGPVDVAVISKGDGFIWIKRKHYFEPELNPRYFAVQKVDAELRRAP